MIGIIFALTGMAFLMIQIGLFDLITMIKGFIYDFDTNMSHDTNWFQDDPATNFYDAF